MESTNENKINENTTQDARRQRSDDDVSRTTSAITFTQQSLAMPDKEEAAGGGGGDNVTPSDDSVDKKNAHSQDQQKSLPSPPPPPDGGTWAWLQVAGGFFVFSNAWGLTNSFGVFQAFYETQLLSSRSSSDISWIGTMQSCFIGFGALYAGPLYDFGYLRQLMVLGAFFVILGQLLTSFCDEYWQLILAQGLCMGIGFGCVVIPSITVVASYFSTKRSTALGVISAGSCIGGVIYPIVFNRLVSQLGFGWTSRIIAFLMIPQLLVPVVFFKQRVWPVKVRAIYDKQAMSEPDFLICWFAFLISYTGAFVPFYYVQLYCYDLKLISGDLVFYLVTLMNAIGLPARVGFGRLADKIGPLNAFILASITSSVILFGWVGVNSEVGIVVFTLLYGASSSGLIALPTAVVAVSMTPDIRDYPVRVTIMCCSLGAGILIGNPIAGALLAHSWGALQCFAGACCAFSTLLCIAARVYRVGWQFTRKI